jgi:hypothetical protein
LHRSFVFRQHFGENLGKLPNRSPHGPRVCLWRKSVAQPKNALAAPQPHTVPAIPPRCDVASVALSALPGIVRIEPDDAQANILEESGPHLLPGKLQAGRGEDAEQGVSRARETILGCLQPYR